MHEQHLRVLLNGLRGWTEGVMGVQELDSEKTIASQNESQGALGRPSGKTLNPSGGSQTMTRSGVQAQ